MAVYDPWKRRKFIVCECCGNKRKHYADGMCGPCNYQLFPKQRMHCIILGSEGQVRTNARFEQATATAVKEAEERKEKDEPA